MILCGCVGVFVEQGPRACGCDFVCVFVEQGPQLCVGVSVGVCGARHACVCVFGGQGGSWSVCVRVWVCACVGPGTGGRVSSNSVWEGKGVLT